MRGIQSELHGGLVGVPSEEGEQVADLLLAGVDDLPGRGLVDGASDVLTEFLELAPQLLQQGVSRQLGLRAPRGSGVGVGDSGPGGASTAPGRLSGQGMTPRIICHARSEECDKAFDGNLKRLPPIYMPHPRRKLRVG